MSSSPNVSSEDIAADGTPMPRVMTDCGEDGAGGLVMYSLGVTDMRKNKAYISVRKKQTLYIIYYFYKDIMLNDIKAWLAWIKDG